VNIKEISEKSGLPYSTTRKYLVLLEESGLLKSSIEEGSRVFGADSVRFVRRIASMSKDGIALKDAIEKIRITPYAVSDDSEVAGLQKQINDLTKEVRSLSDLLQIELSKQKALPERSGFWYHLKAAFRSLFRK
jgi:DNA-binding transcriptional MerR regulator